MKDYTAQSYLCSTNGVETPVVIAGPFSDNADLEVAARHHHIETVFEECLLLFSLTLRRNRVPEFDSVRRVDEDTEEAKHEHA